MSKPSLNGRVFLFQPGYAGGNARSHEMFWVGAISPGSHLQGKVIRSTCYGMSLLANAFNQGWCHALNLRKAFATGQEYKAEGKRRLNPYPRQENNRDYLWEHWNAGYDGRMEERVDFFCMLHDDIVPDNDWLTVLHDELIRCQADVLSVVVPLKDPKGLTSTAIDDPRDFCPERRLTMAEVYALPETFTAADCGYPDRLLLMNTGCWMCRMDFGPFTERNPDNTLKIRFSIDDRIVWDETKNIYLMQTSSEDWEFARDVGKLGGTVMCTRKVKLNHMGSFAFDNKSGNWGSLNFDTATADKFGSKAINNAGVDTVPELDMSPRHWSKVFPDVRGWFKDIEGDLLAELATDKKVLEIGSYCGLSSLWMLRTAEHLSCVDTFDGRGTPCPENTFEEFAANLERYCPDKCNSKHLTVYTREADHVLSKMADRGEKFDLIFIDGAHDKESVTKNIADCLLLLKEDGLLAVHDFGSDEHPDVTASVRENLLTKGARLIAVSGGVGVVDPSKLVKELQVMEELHA